MHFLDLPNDVIYRVFQDLSMAEKVKYHYIFGQHKPSQYEIGKSLLINQTGRFLNRPGINGLKMHALVTGHIETSVAFANLIRLKRGFGFQNTNKNLKGYFSRLNPHERITTLELMLEGYPL